MNYRELIVDEKSILFNTYGMYYKEFPSEINNVRYYTSFVIQKAPDKMKEVNLLEQQLSEIIKNAIKHGNKSDPHKTIRVWYDFHKRAKIIVEDQGPGFQLIEEWNEFNRKRNECFESGDFENFANFVRYRGPHSEDADGGNSLFAALEYWNGGMIYNNSRNKVVVVRYYN